MGRLVDDSNKEEWLMTKAIGMQVKGAGRLAGRWKKEHGRIKRSVIHGEWQKKVSKRNRVETVSLGEIQVSGIARRLVGYESI